MKFSSFRNLITVVACLAVLSLGRGHAQAPADKGSLDHFFTDAQIWTTDYMSLVKRLTPDGYVRDATTGAHTLGDGKAMMDRGANLFGGQKVWLASLEIGETLHWVTFDFLPPPNLALFLTKGDFKSLTRKMEDGVSAALKTKPLPQPYINPPLDKAYKAASVRWVTPELQCIMSTYVTETAGTFKVNRVDLRLGKSFVPGTNTLTKPATLKADRATGSVTLEGLPIPTDWLVKNPEWTVLEQAILTAGKKPERNAIFECASYASQWPPSFIYGTEHIVAASQCRLNVIVPDLSAPANLLKLQPVCVQAAKKLGKNAPQTLLSIAEVDSEVLKMARVSSATLAQFTSTVKQSIAAGKPIFWAGFISIYPVTNAPQTNVTTSARLIIGYNEKEGEVIFWAPQGQPSPRMKIGDALAASYFMATILPK